MTAALLCVLCRTPVDTVCDREDRQEEDDGLVLPHLLSVCPASLRLHREVSAPGKTPRSIKGRLENGEVLDRLTSLSPCVSLSLCLSFDHFLSVFISLSFSVSSLSLSLS